MRKLFFCLSLLIFIACNKNDSPCSIDDRNTKVNFVIDGFTTYAYQYDSLKIIRNDTIYPFFRNSYGEGIKIQLPPEEEINDTLYLNWWNVPDIDTVVVKYKTYKGNDHICKTFEYEHAWFNGVYYPEFGNASQTFYFKKR